MLKKTSAGNVLFYIFMAIGLLSALIYAFTKDSRENYASQSAVRVAEEIFAQGNAIRSVIQQCAIEYPNGGGNMDDTGGSVGIIDAADNPNNPYPLNPSSALNAAAPAGCTTTTNAPGCVAAAADDKVKYLSCVGAPLGSTNMFQGANNQGRFLPPPTGGFSEWTYTNAAAGVYLRTIAPGDAASLNALNRLMLKFSACQADLDYGGCGAGCFTLWILRAACP